MIKYIQYNINIYYKQFSDTSTYKGIEFKEKILTDLAENSNK